MGTLYDRSGPVNRSALKARKGTSETDSRRSAAATRRVGFVTNPFPIDQGPGQAAVRLERVVRNSPANVNPNPS